MTFTQHPGCQRFDAAGWAARKASGLLSGGGVGMVICRGQNADLHMAQLTQLPLTASCFTFVLPFWYWLTWVVPDKGPLNRCSILDVKLCRSTE